MTRAAVVFWAVATAALAGLTGAGAVHAQPPPTPCNYMLSPPEAVPVPGGDMVAATLTPAGCLGAFRPYLSVACVQLQGESPHCTQARGADVARVLMPYRPGATYLSSGRGLGTIFNDMSEPNWQVLGPISATL
jgi:hypothetical protein